jgi:polyisoprenoid-binding protein YceI
MKSNKIINIGKRLLVSAIVMTTFIQANQATPKSGCILAQQGQVVVSWEAFKTPSKIGVGGVFDDVVYKSVKAEGKNFREILVGSTVDINTASVNSNNKGRDIKLINSFFKIMSGEKIEAKIVDIVANKRVAREPRTGTITIEITMNGITKKVPMKYSFDKEVLKGEGFIDILDFQASNALTTLNKACFDKHQGKTWSDVSIGFETKIKAIVCATKPIK